MSRASSAPQAVPSPLTERELHRLLEAGSGRRMAIKLTRNRVSYISFEEVTPGGRLKLRVQRAFLAAPRKVLDSLARWMRTCRGRCPRAVGSFINSQAEADPRPRRRRKTRTAGRVYDLAGMMDEVNREYFRGRLAMHITWGRAVSPKRRVYQRQLGTCDRGRNLVTINPILDQGAVPRFFVAFVVFHEMLHAVEPADAGRGHYPEFRRVERMHPDYRRAERWQRRNLSLLMRPPGTGRGKQRQRPAGPAQGLLF